MVSSYKQIKENCTWQTNGKGKNSWKIHQILYNICIEMFLHEYWDQAIALALEIEKASLTFWLESLLEKISFTETELHALRGVGTGGKKMLCNCGSFRFTVGVI